MLTRTSTPAEIQEESERALKRAQALRAYGRSLADIARRLEDKRSESDIRDDLERRVDERPREETRTERA